MGKLISLHSVVNCGEITNVCYALKVGELLCCEVFFFSPFSFDASILCVRTSGLDHVVQKYPLKRAKISTYKKIIWKSTFFAKVLH